MYLEIKSYISPHQTILLVGFNSLYTVFQHTGISLKKDGHTLLEKGWKCGCFGNARYKHQVTQRTRPNCEKGKEHHLSYLCGATVCRRGERDTSTVQLEGVMFLFFLCFEKNWKKNVCAVCVQSGKTSASDGFCAAVANSFCRIKTLGGFLMRQWSNSFHRIKPLEIF